VSHVVRALIDQGSESSLVAESLAQRLRLPRKHTSVAVYGVGGKLTGFARGLIDVEISSLSGESPLMVSALILPQLTIYHGGIRTEEELWRHLDGLELADPGFFSADPVELLLGTEVCADILQSGLRRDGPLQPVAQRTAWGWILSGAVSSTSATLSVGTYQCRLEEDLSRIVQRFWQQEELALDTPLFSAERECEEHFVRSHSRAPDGRYCVRLPVIEPLPDFSRTRRAAVRLLGHMERRFARDSQLHHLYESFMRDYEALGHMTATAASGEDTRACFLPHHGVLREASTSTKLRVVFNSSTTTAFGDSLNRHLLIGPNLLPP